MLCSITRNATLSTSIDTAWEERTTDRSVNDSVLEKASVTFPNMTMGFVLGEDAVATTEDRSSDKVDELARLRFISKTSLPLYWSGTIDLNFTIVTLLLAVRLLSTTRILVLGGNAPVISNAPFVTVMFRTTIDTTGAVAPAGDGGTHPVLLMASTAPSSSTSPDKEMSMVAGDGLTVAILAMLMFIHAEAPLSVTLTYTTCVQVTLISPPPLVKLVLNSTQGKTTPFTADRRRHTIASTIITLLYLPFC